MNARTGYQLPLGRPIITRAANPRVQPRREPQQTSTEVGICLYCGELFYGPEAIRLMHGKVTYPNEQPNEPKFEPEPYPDTIMVKWLCLDCATEHDILGGERIFQISRRLQEMQKGWCCLCHECIQPFPIKDWSSALRLELGIMRPSTRGNFFQFHPTRGEGHFHWGCLEAIGLDMNAIIESEEDLPTEEWSEEEVL